MPDPETVWVDTQGQARLIEAVAYLASRMNAYPWKADKEDGQRLNDMMHMVSETCIEAVPQIFGVWNPLGVVHTYSPRWAYLRR